MSWVDVPESESKLEKKARHEEERYNEEFFKRKIEDKLILRHLPCGILLFSYAPTK